MNAETLCVIAAFNKGDDLEVDNKRFPIGQFIPNHNLSDEERIDLINQIPGITRTLRNIIKNLNSDQLNTPYRINGWTIKQIVHHLADNDMNAYLRFKRALTEEEPVASTYREDLWAELNDYIIMPIENSIRLQELLHERFLMLLNYLSPEDFYRKFNTQVLGLITLDIALQRFIWHNRHHISQIESLIKLKGW